jgi:hypothetical protein
MTALAQAGVGAYHTANSGWEIILALVLHLLWEARWWIVAVATVASMIAMGYGIHRSQPRGSFWWLVFTFAVVYFTFGIFWYCFGI